MNSSQIYILIAIIVLAGIAIVLRKKMPKPLSPLSSLAFAFVLAGIIFSEERSIGYGLMEVGVVLAVVDAVRRSKKY